MDETKTIHLFPEITKNPSTALFFSLKIEEKEKINILCQWILSQHNLIFVIYFRIFLKESNE